MIIIFFICAFLHTQLLFAEGQNYFVLRNREGAGLFCLFGDVLALLHSYEMGLFRGVEVDFAEEGLYYDPNLGSNWWNYYCEPIAIGEKNSVYAGDGSYQKMSEIFFYKNRQEAFTFIKKYIHFRPYILEKVDQFTRIHLDDSYLIGIHYRGTDAPESCPPYEVVLKIVERVLSTISTTNYKIFIATDEEPFIRFMESVYGDRIVYQQDIYRSTQGGIPLHKNPHHNHSKQGEEAIIDCLLLSKCELQMLSYSNLSLWAALLNPKARVIELSTALPIDH